MRTKRCDANATRFGPEPRPVLRIVIAYDGFAGGKAAMETYGMLVSRFGGEYLFHLAVWRLDFLGRPETDPAAVRDAVEADVLIVAMERETLQPEVVDWAEAWIPRKLGQVGALIALLDFAGEKRSGAFPA